MLLGRAAIVVLADVGRERSLWNWGIGSAGFSEHYHIELVHSRGASCKNAIK